METINGQNVGKQKIVTQFENRQEVREREREMLLWELLLSTSNFDTLPNCHTELSEWSESLNGLAHIRTRKHTIWHWNKCFSSLFLLRSLSIQRFHSAPFYCLWQKAPHVQGLKRRYASVCIVQADCILSITSFFHILLSVLKSCVEFVHNLLCEWHEWQCLILLKTF